MCMMFALFVGSVFRSCEYCIVRFIMLPFCQLAPVLDTPLELGMALSAMAL